MLLPLFYQEQRDDLINPYWIEDPDLKKGEVDFLSQGELQFWKDLLAKYLYPIDANKEEQVNFHTTLWCEKVVDEDFSWSINYIQYYKKRLSNF